VHLIQILLPVADNDGRAFSPAMFSRLRRELTGRFGGVTVHSQAPAEGFWQGEGGPTEDDVVLFEVMAEEVDEPWWRVLRERLERDFRQEEVVIRALPIRRL
jgi:hypothetical protein